MHIHADAQARCPRSPRVSAHCIVARSFYFSTHARAIRSSDSAALSFIYARLAQLRHEFLPQVFDRRSQGREAGREARSEAARRRERGRRHHRRCALPVRQRRPPGHAPGVYGYLQTRIGPTTLTCPM